MIVYCIIFKGVGNIIKVGLGYDIHKIESGGKLIIGGVVVKEGIHSVAHSDGDILAHAVIDALLGASAMADIGEMFPKTEGNKGMNSMEALKSVVEKVSNKGYKILSMDTIVVCAVVKLSPFREMIRENLKRVLGCDVSVKFKSGNGVGEVGRGKAIEAYAVVIVNAGSAL